MWWSRIAWPVEFITEHSSFSGFPPAVRIRDDFIAGSQPGSLAATQTGDEIMVERERNPHIGPDLICPRENVAGRGVVPSRVNGRDYDDPSAGHAGIKIVSNPPNFVEHR